MKNARLFPSFLIAAAMTVLLLTAARAAEDNESATIKFSDPAKPGTVKISVTNGDIHLKGAEINEIHVTTDLKPEEPAQRKDGLRVLTSSSSYSLTEKNNVVSLTYGNDGWPSNGGDFTITVPRNTTVIITSNFGGDVSVGGVTGNIEVKSLNGEVHLDDIDGAALVETMNGEIHASVHALHEGKALSFTSMNGEVSLHLPADAKANVRLRTHNGSILTDFDEKALVTKTESLFVNKRSHSSHTPRAVVVGSDDDDVKQAIKDAAHVAAEAAHEAAVAVHEAANEARVAAHEAANEARTAAREAARASKDDDADGAVAPVAPVPPLPPLPPMTGGKIVTGTLNGGGPEIRIQTMNGDVTLRKIEAEK